MNYIKTLIQITPGILLISIFGYGLFFLLLKKFRKQKTTFFNIFFEFLFFGWIVCFIWITQVLSFGNNMGEPYNLQPLKPLFLAVKYGTTNAAMISQLLMNVIMFVPLGILLPLFFHKVKIGFVKILAGSFILSLLTELIQFLTGRSVDIDDLIANTFGGILGFAIINIFSFIVQKIKLPIPTFKIKDRSSVIISCLVLLIFFSPILIINISETNNEFGFVYYGHPIPTEIEIPEWISDEEGQATIYKIQAKTTLEELQQKLIISSGFECRFNKVGDQVYQCISNTNTETIFIYENLIWTVYYQFGENAQSPANLPEEDEAIKYAIQYLDSFQINTENLAYQGIHDGYSDGGLHLIFEEKIMGSEELVWGNIFVALGENYELISISDNRMVFTAHKTIQTISPRQSEDIAKEVGLGEWNGIARITDIQPSYFFNEEHGYLIPTWQIQATFMSESGQVYSWSPNIDARQ